MPKIRAIETKYNGYRFRSRLEARWAVFFDEAEIPYDYEPEGYVLSDGNCYLPDFYLPWFNMFVEIKPNSISETEIEEAKHKLEMLFDGDCFAEEGKGIIVALMIGDPVAAHRNNNMLVYVNYTDKDGGGTEWRNFSFIEGGWYKYYDEKLKRDIIATFGKRFITVTVDGYNDEQIHNSAYDWCSCIMNSAEMISYKHNIWFARLKARQARFEHGECG